jgi:hypothetical protein
MDPLDGFLTCIECGCVSGELGRGWAAYLTRDPDSPRDPPGIVLYCPPCAASEFGHRPDAAEAYI